MKCKIFTGETFRVQTAFNKWAKGKVLTRKVIIHEKVLYRSIDAQNSKIAIIVYHPEGKDWDGTEPQ